MIRKENIPPDPEQSFRFFSWKGSLEELRVYRGGGSFDVIQGVGHEWHYHREIELTLFTEGKGIRYVGDDVKFFNAPELVLLGPNLPHHWEVEESSGYCIQFLLDPGSPLAGLHESSGLNSLISNAARGLLFSKRCMEEVKELMEHGLGRDPIERLSVFLGIINCINNSSYENLSSSVPQGLSGNKSEVVQKAVRYIVDHVSNENLELQHVLDHIRMSRATFSRHFQQALGQSYTNFVQSIRLETARNLLASTDKPITEIAFAAGFSNLSHFNSLFRKRWSMSPRELRWRLR